MDIHHIFVLDLLGFGCSMFAAQQKAAGLKVSCLASERLWRESSRPGSLFRKLVSGCTAPVGCFCLSKTGRFVPFKDIVYLNKWFAVIERKESSLDHFTCLLVFASRSVNALLRVIPTLSWDRIGFGILKPEWKKKERNSHAICSCKARWGSLTLIEAWSMRDLSGNWRVCDMGVCLCVCDASGSWSLAFHLHILVTANRFLFMFRCRIDPERLKILI